MGGLAYGCAERPGQHSPHVCWGELQEVLVWLHVYSRTCVTDTGQACDDHTSTSGHIFTGMTV